MSPITTHILDLSLGRPAVGVAVTLARRTDAEGWVELGHGRSDADGRIKTLLAAGTTIAPGEYRLDFATAEYFAATGRDSFYPRILIHFRVAESTSHYHVPVLLSPFGYSTYRGT